MLRFDGGLFFANAGALEERIRGLAEARPAARAIVLDVEGANFADSQGSAKLGEIHEFLAADGIRLRLARLKPDTAVVLKADGVLDRVGSEQIHGNVHRAVEAELNAVRELQPG